MQRWVWNSWACFIQRFVQDIDIISSNGHWCSQLSFWLVANLQTLPKYLEAVSYCANINSSIQTNFSTIDERLEKEILAMAKQRELWSLQENYGLSYVYLSLWTGSVRTSYSSFRFGFQAAACIYIRHIIMLNSKQRDEFGSNHDFMTYLKTFYPSMGGPGLGSTDQTLATMVPGQLIFMFLKLGIGRLGEPW